LSLSGFDPAFDGKSTVSFTAPNGTQSFGPPLESPGCESLARTADGSFFIASVSGVDTVRVQRVDANAAPDASWNSGTATEIGFPFAVSDRRIEIEVSAGSVYVRVDRSRDAGAPTTSSPGSSAIARFTASGQVDTAWGSDGVVTVGRWGETLGGLSRDLGAWTATPAGVLLTASQPVLSDRSDSHVLARLRVADGRLDAGFGARGWVASSARIAQIVVGDQHMFTVSGGSATGSRTDPDRPLTIARRNA
jgi:hypothetical protein